MTVGRVLANRLVERVFGKKAVAPKTDEEPRGLKSVSERAKAAAEASRKREATMKHFQEF